MKKLLCIILSAVCLFSVPASADTVPRSAPVFFEASFVQGWYCRDWTESQWTAELRAMREAGFRGLILQSAVDFTYEQTDNSKPKTDPSAFACSAAYALYPSAAVSGSEDAHALADALAAAKETGMQIYIGTVSDDRWWNYGWGKPDADFSLWSAENAARNADVIREVWAFYGAEYGAQIAGFYYYNEIWNIDAACAGTDDGAYAKTIGENIRECVDAITELCPEKPLIISPFYNTDLSGSAEYGAFLRAIAEEAALRPQDVIAPQDGGGRNYTQDTILEWTDAVRYAVGDAVRYWVNNETFDADYTAKSMEQLRQDYLASSAAEKHLLFSWNHYYHGSCDEDFAVLCRKMTGDVNADGICSMADLIALRRFLFHDRIVLQNWIAADLDGNSRLNAADLTLLKRALLADPTE